MARTTQPRTVSHVSARARAHHSQRHCCAPRCACACRSKRNRRAPRLRTASHGSALAGTSGLGRLDRYPVKPGEFVRGAQPASEDLLRVATPWSALIKRR